MPLRDKPQAYIPRTILATTVFSTLMACSDLQSIPKSLRCVISLGLCPLALYSVLAREKNIHGLGDAKARLQELEKAISRGECVTSEDVLWVGRGAWNGVDWGYVAKHIPAKIE